MGPPPSVFSEFNTPLVNDPLPHDMSSCNDVPAWLAASLGASSDLTPAAHVAKQRCKPLDSDDDLPQHPPSLDAPSISISRISIGELTPQELYWKFWRPGLPLVVSGLAASGAEWSAYADRAITCCDAELEHLRTTG